MKTFHAMPTAGHDGSAAGQKFGRRRPAQRGVWTFSPVSRSETTMVAVGLSPRIAAKHAIRRRGATAERSNRAVAFNRRSATRDHNTPPPWTEVHGYRHGLALRGGAEILRVTGTSPSRRAGAVRSDARCIGRVPALRTVGLANR